MSINSFGRILKITTFGESHGPTIGCVIDGVPPNIALCEEDIQQYLNKRKPGTSIYTTQRKEPDIVQIVSGVFEGHTTGTSLALLIANQDTRSKDYGDIKNSFRPGHADYTYQQKYGIRDYRGGGRSSARETAMRVAAGAVARKIITHILPEAAIEITGFLTQIGEHHIDKARFDKAEINNNPFFCPDKETVPVWEEYMRAIRKQGSSIGAMVEVIATHVPAGLGAPIYGKLDADLASAMMSINAVKAVEIGDGMRVAGMRGEDNADPLLPSPNGVVFGSNHAGGILGGISSGQDIIVRFAIKPTSSILIPQKSVNSHGEAQDIITKGRHDPCVGIRAVPVGEAMMALTLADHILCHKAQCGF